MTATMFDGSFAHRWIAEILPSRPMILPPRHYTYPAVAEEVEKGAMEVLIRPETGLAGSTAQYPMDAPIAPEPFLATCALGFRDAAAPSGLWSMPDPDWICAVSGGYAYLINATCPEQFTMIAYRPVLEIVPVVEQGLLLFVGHHAILAWGRNGEAWQSDRLSWEGIAIREIEDGVLRGTGWDMMTDKDVPFALDLHTGGRIAV